MRLQFFPKEVDFFEIFDLVSKNLIEVSTQLVELFERFDNLEGRVQRIHDIEHDTDELTHETMRRLSLTFLTPIDREDIHAIASSLDDVLDLMWAAGDRTALFQVESGRAGAVVLARSLLENCAAVHRAIQELKRKDYKALQKTCIEINRLENDADRIFREAIGELFEDERDPILIIKWKEILEHLELATDKCEDVANTLETIVLKHV